MINCTAINTTCRSRRNFDTFLATIHGLIAIVRPQPCTIMFTMLVNIPSSLECGIYRSLCNGDANLQTKLASTHSWSVPAVWLSSQAADLGHFKVSSYIWSFTHFVSHSFRNKSNVRRVDYDMQTNCYLIFLKNCMLTNYYLRIQNMSL